MNFSTLIPFLLLSIIFIPSLLFAYHHSYPHSCPLFLSPSLHNFCIKTVYVNNVETPLFLEKNGSSYVISGFLSSGCKMFDFNLGKKTD
jgi:hypothetical protein